MDFQPILTGELALLRPTVAEDWEGMFAVASDPLIWEQHPFHDRWQEPVFRAYFEDALASGGGLTVLDKASGAAIGASRYAFPDAARDEMEIGGVLQEGRVERGNGHMLPGHCYYVIRRGGFRG